MLFRTLAYILIGWLLLAAVPALGLKLGITVMLPSTTAVLLAHLAFSRQGSLPWALSVATTLGYLEDFHQGAPLGTLAFAHGLALVGLRWTAARIAVRGIFSRTMAALATVVVIDLVTWAILMLLADALGFSRDSLLQSLWLARWHILATVLVAHPVWVLVRWSFRILGVDQPPPSDVAGRGRSLSVIRK